LSHTSSSFFHFVLVILEIEVLQIICPGWPLTTIFLISSSQTARIIDVSHQHPASYLFLED
jgi:hypothetical protein